MKKSVLFLCSGNSARSQMAEAVLRQLAPEQFDAASAGTQPEGVDPRTLQVLEKAGIDTAGLASKAAAQFSDQHFDYVISLCDKAHQECKHWPGAGVIMAWDFPDPKASKDPLAFARTLQEISERLRLFVLVNSKQVSEQTKPLSAVEFYKALADETRLLSLLLIEQHGELCVCDLITALDESQPKISRHLAQLRKSGILQDRRQGQWVHYSLHPLLEPWMREVLHTTRLNNTPLLQLPTQRVTAAQGCSTGAA
ncbi:metalloregulator ArsR/SmtB family transcription factor [Venatoribacter cucullus]|uniref:metalloregulator ArsR/SmtB family transcription factor n=1 Tax=Venatoribacter cucullus TaxID=2661630 RepID=UPI001937EA63|nr:metalloregulator ArsR/SmtB family transcription factor [Oceanospirillaceae bacterium ASx5O]UZK02641.1 metalloregulator ArsR/SmtB family transcription factor [Venatoribacter cucullus]